MRVGVLVPRALLCEGQEHTEREHDGCVSLVFDVH